MAGRWSDALLDAKRQIGDPSADRLIDELDAGSVGGAVSAVRSLMTSLLENDGLPPLDSALLRDFLAETGSLPAWAQPQLIELGQEVFRKWGPQICMSLFFAALPAAYTAAKGVKALALTARLESDTKRRIMETAQFVLDVMQPGSLLDPDGVGIRSAQKVRLVHAVVRNLIQEHAKQIPGLWDNEWGVPINQEDLAGTLMTFSTITLDSLRKVGTELGDDEVEAYVHTWNVIGHLLGIDIDLLPVDAADAQDQVQTIQRRQWAPSPEGERMAAALIELMQALMPGQRNDGLPAAMVRYLIGDEPADMLGLERATRDRLATRFLFLITRHYHRRRSRNRVLSAVVAPLGRQILENSSLVGRHEGRPSFRVPDQLRVEWQLGRHKPLAARRLVVQEHGG